MSPATFAASLAMNCQGGEIQPEAVALKLASKLADCGIDNPLEASCCRAHVPFLT
jgi:hypothetical protein